MYKLILSYDGSRYFGWQKTKMGPSIQEELQIAILQITKEKVLPEAASRTDRGVHAKGQVVSFDLYQNNLKNRFLAAPYPKDDASLGTPAALALPHNFDSHSRLASRQWSLAPNQNSEEPPCQIPDSSGCFGMKKSWDPDALKRALNAILPECIRIHELEEISHFHPTLDAKEKEYHYHICLGIQMPMDRLYSWNFKYPLDLAKMEKASKKFLGTHDFSSFANEKKENPICSLSEIRIIPDQNRLNLAIRGDRFLYKMARNIAGTLVYIGSGKLKEDSIPEIFASKTRALAGITAPAHGLVLYNVFY